MIYELVLFTAWLCFSILVTVGGFYFGRFILRKIDDFFDRRRR